MVPDPYDVVFKSTDENGNVVANKSNGVIRDYPRKNPYDTKPGEKPYVLEIVWRNVFIMLYAHCAALKVFWTPCQLSTILIAVGYGILGSWGIAAGAHRLMAHKSYKANRNLQLLLIFFQTIALQNSCIEWVRDHRVHHKYSDTNADPHNASRGFFFSHMGWLLCKKHPDVRKYGSRISMADLECDPVLRFQHKYYVWLVLLISLSIPIFISTYIFGDTFSAAYHMNIFRIVLAWHITWSINSVSHIWGNRPFEKDILPTDTFIIGFLAFGEGWHNFHHVYPWDYKVSELPNYYCNFTIPFIDFFAWLGWATDLKMASDEMIRKRIMKSGDGTHRYSIEEAKKKKTAKELLDLFNNKVLQKSNPHELEGDFADTYWGYGDNDIPEEEIKDITILKPTKGK
ncbi:hypothetical protein PVAND_001403 [Polypedilum vanderplanki]|uniref:Fatty acid desaturase domain-containing protein n=1 Tax=Polypedilum vanderplanki TaxID=319348 RepID=A0A9J6BNA7_POLVA|nr:hypothetical protein PVAND_001403 [Polypedilum vanderplanki]